MGEGIGIPLTTFPGFLIGILQEVLFVVGVLHVSDVSLFSYRFWVRKSLFGIGMVQLSFRIGFGFASHMFWWRAS